MIKEYSGEGIYCTYWGQSNLASVCRRYPGEIMQVQTPKLILCWRLLEYGLVLAKMLSTHLEFLLYACIQGHIQAHPFLLREFGLVLHYNRVNTRVLHRDWPSPAYPTVQVLPVTAVIPKGVFTPQPSPEW